MQSLAEVIRAALLFTVTLLPFWIAIGIVVCDPQRRRKNGGY